MTWPEFKYKQLWKRRRGVQRKPSLLMDRVKVMPLPKLCVVRVYEATGTCREPDLSDYMDML